MRVLTLTMTQIHSCKSTTSSTVFSTDTKPSRRETMLLLPTQYRRSSRPKDKPRMISLSLILMTPRQTPLRHNRLKVVRCQGSMNSQAFSALLVPRRQQVLRLSRPLCLGRNLSSSRYSLCSRHHRQISASHSALFRPSIPGPKMVPPWVPSGFRGRRMPRRRDLGRQRRTTSPRLALRRATSAWALG